jgi:uncharacterized protein (TIGR03435 family)
MTKTALVLTALITGTGLLRAAAPDFEVASVKRSQAGKETIQTSPGTLVMRNVTLISCLTWAYGVQRYQILTTGAGMGWVGAERYDILAKAEGAVPDNQLKLMLRSLLSDRFHLAIRSENRTISIFALVMAKGGPKFHESEGEGKMELKPLPAGMVARFATMGDLANLLAGRVETPVADETGLKGRYDFTIDVSSFLSDPTKPVQVQDMAAVLVTSLQEQLGLRLESKKGPVEMLVVEGVARPSEN